MLLTTPKRESYSILYSTTIQSSYGFFNQILVYIKSRFTQIVIHGYVQNLSIKYTNTLRRNDFESESIDVA